LCFLLSLIRRLGRLLRGGIKDRAIRKLCLIKVTERGALIVAHQAFRRAIELVGRDNVYVVIADEGREIAEVMALIRPANIVMIRTRFTLMFFIDWIRALARIRSFKIDAVADMEFSARATSVFTCLSGAGRRAGFTYSGQPYCGRLLTHEVPYSPYRHMALQYYMLVESLAHGASSAHVVTRSSPQLRHPPPEFHRTLEETEQVCCKLRLPMRTNGAPCIIMSPCVKDLLPLRAWPERHFDALAEMLGEANPDSVFILTGTAAERTRCQMMSDRLRCLRVLNAAGAITVRELLVLYGMSDLLVTNDSGPAHFASMTGIKAIVLFGVGSPLLWRPLRSTAHIVSQNYFCSPCMNAANQRTSTCRHNACMTDITPERVYPIAIEMLCAARKVNGDS